MPYYTNSQGARLIEHGWPIYLFGSHSTPGGEMYITTVAITGNVATIGVTSWSGGLPTVGSTIAVRGSQVSSGVFNTTMAVITAVNLDVNGTGTISYAVTNANIATTPDVGRVTFSYAVVGETIAVGTSIPGSPSNALPVAKKVLFCDVTFPTLPTAVTVTLQTAMRNFDADFTDMGTVATVTASAVVQSQANFETNAPFVRFRISGLTGTGTLAGRVTM